MLTKLFKFTLMITSLSPVIAILGITQIKYSKCSIFGKIPLIPSICIASSLALWAVCYIVVNRASKTGRNHEISIKEFDRRDQSLITFVFIYLFPLIRNQSALSATDYILYSVVFILIVFIMIDVGAYQLNPMMRLCGYKFYLIKDCSNVRILLVTTTMLRMTNTNIQTKRISHDVYIETRNK